MLRNLSSLLLGSASLSALTLTASCGPHVAPPQQQRVYASYQQCLIERPNDPQCRIAYDQALRQQISTAPHYGAYSDCYSAYSQCEYVHDGGGGFFMPYMMGYMMGGGGSYGPRYYPVYYNRGGALCTGRTQITTVAPSIVRGGFGASSSRSISVVPTRTGGFYATSAPAYTSAVSRASSIGGSSGARSSFSSTGSVARGGFGATAASHASFGGFGGGE